MAIVAYTKDGKTAYRAKFKFKNLQPSKRGFKTQKEAKAWITQEIKRLEKLEKEASSLLPSPIPVLMFSETSSKYLEDCLARVTPGTYSEKSRHLTSFAEWLGGDIALEDITEETAQNFIAYARSISTNKTANRYLTNVSAYWNWTSRRFPRETPRNPFSSIESYPEDAVLRYVPPLEDVLAVLAKAEQWERDFLHTLVKTGARPIELRDLTWDDVSLARRAITLWTRKRRGGGRTPRVLNMSDQLLQMMERRFKDRDSETWVFINPETGDKFNRQSRPYKYLMERLCDRASTDDHKIKRFTLYAFRHFVALRIRDSKKASRYEIQYLLGHTRSDTTDLYLRSLAPELETAVAVMDDAVNLDLIPEDPQNKTGKILKMTRA